MHCERIKPFILSLVHKLKAPIRWLGRLIRWINSKPPSHSTSGKTDAAAQQVLQVPQPEVKEDSPPTLNIFQKEKNSQLLQEIQKLPSASITQAESNIFKTTFPQTEALRDSVYDNLREKNYPDALAFCSQISTVCGERDQFAELIAYDLLSESRLEKDPVKLDYAKKFINLVTSPLAKTKFNDRL